MSFFLWRPVHIDIRREGKGHLYVRTVLWRSVHIDVWLWFIHFTLSFEYRKIYFPPSCLPVGGAAHIFHKPHAKDVQECL